MAQLGLALNRGSLTMCPARSKMPAAHSAVDWDHEAFLTILLYPLAELSKGTPKQGKPKEDEWSPGRGHQPSTLGFGTRCLDLTPQCQPLLVFALDEGQNLQSLDHPEHGVAGVANSSHFTELSRKWDTAHKEKVLCKRKVPGIHVWDTAIATILLILTIVYIEMLALKD